MSDYCNERPPTLEEAARETREAARIVAATKGIDLLREIERQDAGHPAGYPATRDGLRLALAALQDEHDEAHDAHRAERKAEGWEETRTELLQAAAVCIRAIRSIDTPGATSPASP